MSFARSFAAGSAASPVRVRSIATLETATARKTSPVRRDFGIWPITRIDSVGKDSVRGFNGACLARFCSRLGGREFGRGIGDADSRARPSQRVCRSSLPPQNTPENHPFTGGFSRSAQNSTSGTWPRNARSSAASFPADVDRDAAVIRGQLDRSVPGRPQGPTFSGRDSRGDRLPRCGKQPRRRARH